MTSTGNDIVALAAINIARTKQPNFYSKILSGTEMELYDQEFRDKLSFEHFVWLAWSVKESVYKFLQKFTPDLVFSPTKIIIGQLSVPVRRLAAQTTIEGCDFRDIPVYKALVEFIGRALYSRSVITDNFIFSAVNDKDDFTNTCWGIQQIDSMDHEYQSQKVREFLISRLCDLFPDTHLQIGKSPHGWPVVINGETELPVPVSLAHHGHFVAYSFQLSNSQWKAHQLPAAIS
jgi:phosphopantetheinyl transferase (holo-ACP synthase)